MTNERNNPWAGLASYEDPAKSERKLKFCGRDNDIYDVARLIDDNLLLILYGKSGIGKTSLLNAGVFPKLRLDRYLPVSVRLGTLDADYSYQEAIISAIEKAIEEVGGSKTTINVVEEQTDNRQPERLWNYFARNRFVDTEGQPLFPVVALDQFEEVLRNATPERVGKAQTLLNQLQYLIDESHALNDCIVDGKEYFYDFNFRFVISIREDELYLLEDNIDDLSLSMFRNCRYRLRSLSEQGATEAILLPGKDCIVIEQQYYIVKRIIKLSKRPQSNDIDTLLLSLVCSGTFDKKAGEMIALTDLAVWKNNPMEVYYQDAVKGITADQVRYIQQHLIREDGSRRRVDAEEVKAALGEATYRQLTLGSNRLLTLGDKGQVELLHDQLGLAVYEERKAFEERERKKRLRRRMTIIGMVMFTIASVFVFQNNKINKQNDDLIKLQIDLDKQRWIACKGQSLFIVEKSKSLYNEGNSRLAHLLLLETFQPNRPYIAETEQTIRLFESNNPEIIRFNSLLNKSDYQSNNIKYLLKRYDNLDITRETSNAQKIIKDTLITNSNYIYYSTFIDSELVASADSNAIKIWNINSKELVQILYLDYPEQIKKFLNDDKVDSLNKVLRLKDNSIISIKKNGADIEAESENGTLRRWNVNTGKMVYHEGHRWRYKYVEKFHNDNLRWISIDAFNNTIYIHDPDPKDRDHDINSFYSRSVDNLHTGTINTVSIERFNNQFVSASSDSTMIIWYVKSGQHLHSLIGHNGGVNSAFYSSDGKYIVSASDDGTIKVWEAESGVEVSTIVGHQGRVLHAEFNLNNNLIVSSSDDGTIRIWEFPHLQDLIDQTRERFEDCSLTDAERRMYYLE